MRLYQESLVTEHYAQLVELSEGHLYKEFQIIWQYDSILGDCCGMKFQNEEQNEKLEVDPQVFKFFWNTTEKFNFKVLIYFLENN